MLHYLLIPIEDERQTLESITLLPLEVQLELAEYDITSEQLAEYFQIHFGQKVLNITEPTTETNYIEVENNKRLFKYANEVVRSITSADYFIITYNDGITEETLAQDEDTILSCNNEVLVNVKRNDIGYSIDVYNQKKQNAEGLFGSIIVLDEDL